jgi:predicted DCC family thiol-disulfide oxidoreductase YuxK
VSSGYAVLIFDGDCGFCTSAARWAEKRFRGGERAKAWQLLGPGALDSFGLSVDDVQQAAWWVSADGTLDRGHRAVGRALQACGGWRRVAGWLTLTPPTSWLAAGIYKLVVRWRYRLPGGTPACRIPRDSDDSTVHDSDQRPPGQV